MDLSVELLDILGKASPIVVLAVVVLYGMRSLNLLSSNLRDTASSLQQMALAMATINSNQQTIIGRMEDVVDRSQTVAEQIGQLRLELDKHIIAINVRFDQLPDQLQRVVMTEWMRFAQGNHNQPLPRRGWLARLFG